MKFNLPRQQVSDLLNLLVSKKIKQNKIDIPVICRNNLKEMAVISQKIKKNGLPSNLVLKKLGGKLGYGVFLHPEAEPILKGEVIAPYSGEVVLSPQNQGENSDYVFSLISDLLLTKQEQKFLDPKVKYHPKRLYSLDLDAYKKGNFTRYINHSYKPNIEAELVRIPHNALGLYSAPFEMLYIAYKKILPGEQLLICYEGEEDTYWGPVKIKPFPMTPKTFRLDSSLKIIR